jgi:methionyl-tRNA formyltransferase
MNIDIVITDPKHPLLGPVRAWATTLKGHRVRVRRRLASARGGDALVLVACHEIARPAVRSRYRRTYVTHASDLPEGRGWSPLVWTVLEGKPSLVLSLIEAADPVDSGRLFAKFRCRLAGTDLWPDINAKLARLLIRCLNYIVAHPASRPKAQRGRQTWYRRRTPADGRLDSRRSLASQFDLLRVCDPERFPAFFDFRGQRFELTIRKAGQRPA